jgi:hypothetical protein
MTAKRTKPRLSGFRIVLDKGVASPAVANKEVAVKHGRWLVLAVLMMAHADAAWAGTFREDFDGPSLDPAKWSFSPGEGGLTFVDGTVILSSPGGRFPFITPLGNPFPDGDWSLRVRFRFPSVAACGNGLGSTRDGADPMSQSGFALWQDTGWGMRVAVGDMDPVNLVAGADTSFHEYEWDRLGRTYLFYFDGAFVGSDESDLSPTSFFFGHPQFVTCGTWTSQQIDVIQITSAGPTPTQRITMGRLRSYYR